MSYGGATSVYTASGASSLLHNRLTHSLKVGQVGRRMSQYLLADPKNRLGIDAAGGLDPNVVEAAGRAHDLGHPPFGHIGEEVLDEIARCHGLSDGFEGNAQTFRILATLIKRYSGEEHNLVEGLGLTEATLAACVKYPWERGKSGKRYQKYGYIDVDEGRFNDLVAPYLKPDPDKGTLEAQIMDWADDISYATHDIEDFSLDGRIPLWTLAHDQHGKAPNAVFTAVNPEQFDAFWTYADVKLSMIGKVATPEAKRQFQLLSTLFPRRQADGSRNQEALLQKLASHIITLTSKATTVLPTGELDRDVNVVGLVEALKQLTWYFVIDRPEIISMQRGQVKRLRAVTEEFISWATHVYRTEDKPIGNGEPRKISANEMVINAGALPPLLRDLIDSLLETNNRHMAYPESRSKNIVRGVIDFVASLREAEVDEYYQRMC